MTENQKLTMWDVLFPLLFVFIMVLVKFIEISENLNFAHFGIFPRKVESLLGIFFSPFIHGDWEHLINNSVPMLLLGMGIFYFYKPVAIKIYLYSIIITGIWVWAAARPSYHIGASGVVYAFASFIFFSGFIRKYYRLIALSLTVVFIYGSMIWGIFPIKHGISWESHLLGSLAGFILAINFRKYGPQRKIYEWQEDEQDDDDETNPDDFWYLEDSPDDIPEKPSSKNSDSNENQLKNSSNLSTQQRLKFVYRYKPKED